MIHYFDEISARKRASDVLHLVLIVFCAAMVVGYIFTIPKQAIKQELLAKAVSNAGIGQWMITETGEFRCDDRAMGILGLKSSDLSELTSRVHPDDREYLLNSLHALENDVNNVSLTLSFRVMTSKGEKLVRASGVSFEGKMLTGILHEE